MPFIRGLVTVVKVTSLTYRLVATGILLGSALITVKNAIKKARHKD